MTLDAGDWRTPHLLVNPYDSTTAVTLTVTTPAGATISPTVSASTMAGRWDAVSYQLAVAGEWVETWTVTGTGAGRESTVLLVAPAPTATSEGRVYATTTDLANGLHSAPPAGSRVLLKRASRDVDDALLCAIYNVDDDGMPTDTEVSAALRAATVEQVCGMLASGDAKGIGAQTPQSFSIGGLNVNTAGTGPAKIGRLYRQAWLILQQAGLTNFGPEDL